MHAYEKGRHVLFLLEPSPAGSFSHIKKDMKTMATVYIGSDHAGLELKAALVKRLSEKRA